MAGILYEDISVLLLQVNMLFYLQELCMAPFMLRWTDNSLTSGTQCVQEHRNIEKLFFLI